MGIPRLPALLNEKTTFVLGAGASKDYGFPLWGEFKLEILELCRDPEFTRGVPNDAVQYWVENLHDDQTKSVDLLAHEADDEPNELFRKLVGTILIEREAQHLRSQKPGWIEMFCEKFLNLALDQTTSGLINNIGFISLNYDRCFPFLYHREFLLKLVSQADHRQRIRERFWASRPAGIKTLYQPHGSLGSIIPHTEAVRINQDSQTIHNASESYGVPYGEPSEFASRFTQRLPHIYAVDELQITEYDRDLGPTYKRSNALLNQSKNIVLVGLSADGWQQAHLVKPEGATVYTTGNAELAGGEIPIGGYANELVEML